MTASLAVFAAAVTITAAGLAAVAVGSLVAEVRRLRDENAALERKLNAALVDVVNMANEETAAAEAHEEALDRLRDVETLAREALAELDAQPELAHPDAVWYTGAALRDALEADRG